MTVVLAIHKLAFLLVLHQTDEPTKGAEGEAVSGPGEEGRP